MYRSQSILPPGSGSPSNPKMLPVIFLTVFIDLIGFGIVIPVLPLYAERFGASPLVIGLLLGIYSAMQLIFAPLLGKLSDRIGRRPVLLLSVLGTALGFLLMGFARTLWLLFVARVIDGVTGGNISIALAYIADVTSPEDRSKKMGLIGAAFGLGFIVGPALGGLFSHISAGAPFFFAAALAACNGLGIYFFLPESLSAHHRQQAKGQISVFSLFREANARALGIVIATYFLTTVAFSLVTATYPLFTERRFGFGAAQNGYLFACQGAIGAIVQGGLLGWLMKVWSDRMLATVGVALLMASLFVLPMGGTILFLFVATAGMAIGHGLVASTLNGLASKAVNPASQGRVMVLMQSASSFARIVGPVMGGWLLNVDALRQAGPFGRTPYWAGGLVLLAALALSAMIDG